MESFYRTHSRELVTISCIYNQQPHFMRVWEPAFKFCTRLANLFCHLWSFKHMIEWMSVSERNLTWIQVAILAEMKLSKKASDKLLQIYVPFLGLAVLALLRGLFCHSEKSITISRRPFLHRKKRAWNQFSLLQQMAEIEFWPLLSETDSFLILDVFLQFWI